MGLMQIMPWVDLRSRYGLGANPFDPGSPSPWINRWRSPPFPRDGMRQARKGVENFRLGVEGGYHCEKTRGQRWRTRHQLDTVGIDQLSY
jgi:hypothetical protein